MMMRLLQSCLHSSNSWSTCVCARNFYRVLFCTSTSPLISSALSQSQTTLFSRLLPASHPSVSILPILDQWVQEGRPINKKDLINIIKQFRKYRRFSHALEITEWASRQRYLDASPGNVAVQLDLISKVHGLKRAEEFFNNIPSAMRGLGAYGALLNCYVNANSLEKAEHTMQKMRELGYFRTFSYNAMLNLYSRMEKYDKLESLFQEMEAEGIAYDKFTFNIQANAYAATSELDKMEELLAKMEANHAVHLDWNAYAVTAHGFLKAGKVDKALAMLKKCEQAINFYERNFAYQVLLTHYTSLGKKDEVYRVWNLHKSIGKFTNTAYLCMLSSLAKLGDIDGAKEILEEWEAKHRSFDMRLPNILISAYCNKGLLEKAERIVSRLIESGKKPDASSWDRMALGYSKNNEMAKAVEATKKALLAIPPSLKWKHNSFTLASCLEYLKGKGDMDMAEELIRLLEKQGVFSKNVIEGLVKFIDRGNPETKALGLILEIDQISDGGMLGAEVQSS